MLPFEGIRIIDFTRVLSGPFATMILADFGADVIKVELTEVGDDSRYFGPFVNDDSAYFMSVNRNKKSITINTKDPRGIQLAKELLTEADVVVENFKPQTMEKLGLGYEDIKAINPEIIYVACSGFGHSGPLSDRPAYDAIIQAMGGIMSITGSHEGDFTRVGSSISDIIAGMYSAIGTMTALYHKAKTGQGQKVDVAMLDCQVSILENAISRYFVEGVVPKAQGNYHSSITPFEDFPCQDHIKLFVAAGNDGLWRKFCRAMELEALIDDPRFQSNPLRTKNRDQLKVILDERFQMKNSDAWYQLLSGAGVPVSFINTIDKVVNHEQVVARGMIVDDQRPLYETMKLVNTPVKLSLTPGSIRSYAPGLGEHTDEVLKELLNKSDAEIEELKKNNIV